MFFRSSALSSRAPGLDGLRQRMSGPAQAEPAPMLGLVRVGVNNNAQDRVVMHPSYGSIARIWSHLSPREAGAQGNRCVNLLDGGEAHAVVAKPALPAASVNLLAAVHGQGRQGRGAVSLPLAQSEGRGLGADGTKSGNDANDEMGAKAHGAEPRLVW